jgi:hypothetical protein
VGVVEGLPVERLDDETKVSSTLWIDHKLVWSLTVPDIAQDGVAEELS